VSCFLQIFEVVQLLFGTLLSFIIAWHAHSVQFIFVVCFTYKAVVIVATNSCVVLIGCYLTDYYVNRCSRNFATNSVKIRLKLLFLLCIRNYIHT